MAKSNWIYLLNESRDNSLSTQTIPAPSFCLVPRKRQEHVWQFCMHSKLWFCGNTHGREAEYQVKLGQSVIQTELKRCFYSALAGVNDMKNNGLTLAVQNELLMLLPTVPFLFFYLYIVPWLHGGVPTWSGWIHYAIDRKLHINLLMWWTLLLFPSKTYFIYLLA